MNEGLSIPIQAGTKLIFDSDTDELTMELNGAARKFPNGADKTSFNQGNFPEFCAQLAQKHGLVMEPQTEGCEIKIFTCTFRSKP
ncbi:MAG: hypothetical protein WCT08_05595 [Patescibacteria group bacterium]|jgi:hypothetical protein